MKNYLTIALISGLVTLTGCATNKPLTAEQQAIIKQHKIVVTKQAKKPLMVLSKANKTGTIVASVALGVLTGSFGGGSDGNTPRTRLNEDSAGQFIKSSGRRAAAEKLDTVTPTQYMQEMLAKQFAYLKEGDKDSANQFVIDIKPVAWQLFYNKLFNGESTYVLEYAGDITMKLDSADIRRYFPCDETSDASLSKEDWLANDQLRIRQFSREVAQTCVNSILKELGKNTEAQ